MEKIVLTPYEKERLTDFFNFFSLLAIFDDELVNQALNGGEFQAFKCKSSALTFEDAENEYRIKSMGSHEGIAAIVAMLEFSTTKDQIENSIKDTLWMLNDVVDWYNTPEEVGGDSELAEYDIDDLELLVIFAIRVVAKFIISER